MNNMRKNNISWDEFYMGIALISAERSKDPNTQVGACIVSKDHIVLATGYNGMPIGCDDNEMPWDREGSCLDTKYPYVVHAELNAILNRNTASLKGATIFVTLFPCNECAKAIIQSGIERVVYYSNKYPNSDATMAAFKMFMTAGVELSPYTGTKRQLVLNL
jgi:dCMP deaminase